MKKTILILVSLAMVVGLVGCTTPAENSENTNNTAAETLYQGFGLSNLHRVGPGKDDTDTQVYSINQVFANVIFDEEGRIVDIMVDQLEVSTPNYDGDGMPHFSGFPGQGGYNYDEDHDGIIDGKTEDTDENFTEEVESWTTKRERGDAYRMVTGTWAEQMDAFEEFFVGMTVTEVVEWFNKYTSSLNGRPLKDGVDSDYEQGKYDALNDEEKSMLVDLTSKATMSLNDSHGNIIQAIRNAYDNRIEVESDTNVKSIGLALVNNPRLGPGNDDTDTPVYSINQIFANTLFDEEGKIVNILVDQLEVSTPNYDGEGMPHFSGFPGQGGYNYDEDHDGVVDSKTVDSEGNLIAEVASWATKRDRGESYRMGAGSWAEQMNKFQEQFVGMTTEEVEEWFVKYTSDINGRPLKDGSANEEDKVKYDALSDDEKAMLSDLTSGATMSLNDSHGDIIQAIKASFENARDLKSK